MHDHGRLHMHHHEVPASPMSPARRATALAILCLCALTAGLDMTITNVALPFIARDLDAPTNELQWTVNAYNIVLAGVLVLGGALADRYGRRRVFLLGYILFALASVAAAFSPDAAALIAARAVMGLGAAGVTAPALAIIASMYTPAERAGPIGTFVVFGAAGLAIGPIAGGLLLDHFWWGSVFLVNVPIIVVGVVVGAAHDPGVAGARAARGLAAARSRRRGPVGCRTGRAAVRDHRGTRARMDRARRAGGARRRHGGARRLRPPGAAGPRAPVRRAHTRSPRGGDRRAHPRPGLSPVHLVPVPGPAVPPGREGRVDRRGRPAVRAVRGGLRRVLAAGAVAPAARRPARHDRERPRGDRDRGGRPGGWRCRDRCGSASSGASSSPPGCRCSSRRRQRS